MADVRTECYYGQLLDVQLGELGVDGHFGHPRLCGASGSGSYRRQHPMTQSRRKLVHRRTIAGVQFVTKAVKRWILTNDIVKNKKATVKDTIYIRYWRYISIDRTQQADLQREASEHQLRIARRRLVVEAESERATKAETLRMQVQSAIRVALLLL